MNEKGGHVANGGGGVVVTLLKYLFGDLPAQWIRLIIFGAACAAAFFLARDFKREILAESAATRASLDLYMKANQVWQETSKEERTRLIRKANVRIKRLYDHNKWLYEEIEP